MHYRKFTQLSVLTLIVAFTLSVISTQAQNFNYSDAWGKAGYTLENQTRSNVEINFSIHNFSVSDTKINGATMQDISLEGIFLPNDEGAPNLPGASRYIAIPEGAKPVLKIVDYRIETIKGLEVAPAPRIPLDTDDGPLHYEKSKIYTQDAFYPKNPIQISEITEIRGVDAVMLGITPFQYNPVTKELLVYRDVKVEISFEGGKGEFGDNRLRNRWWDPIMQDVFLNSASLPVIDYNKQRHDAMANTREAGCEYLIVIPNNPEFMQWADSIRDFRQKQGILTKIVTLAEIGANTVTVLENYFNDAFNTWDIPPAAVLLMADYGTSMDNSITSPIWDSYCVSDNIFADVNNNDMPDMVFARITANNAEQLETMVTKFIHYEKNPPTNPDFYNHPITALGWQTERWFQVCSETVGGFWREVQGKEPVRINAVYSGATNVWSTATNTGTVLAYFGPSGLGYIPTDPGDLGGWSGGTPAQVNAAINAGSFMLQHRDHGFEQGWGEPAYTSTHISSLTNTDLTFVMSINCLTGKYNWSSESFAEKFHRYKYNGHNSGALGLIAASEVSYSFVNDAYVWGVYDNMWPNFLPDYGMPIAERDLLPAFGNASGKYFLQQSSWPYNTSNKEVTYNLFHLHGGAFLNVYSEVPQYLTVTHNPILFSGETSFTVNANEGSFIALTVNGEIIGTAEGTGAPVSITIDSQLPPNMMTVTITKQNYYRYEEMVEVIPPSGPYVVYNDLSIDDTQGGNGDGMMDYDENLLLDITLKNVGVETASGVTATLSCESEYITITDATADFGDIAANSTATLAGAFAIEVAANIPDDLTVSFAVSATNGTTTWESFFAIASHAPMLEILGVTISDVSGNNNGYLDPGENADIMFETANNGSSNAAEVMASLVAMSPFVTLNNSSVNLETLDSGETAVATFNITVDAATPIGTVLELIYSVESGMYSVNNVFGLKVGLIIEDFESGDFSSYEWEFGGNANWIVTSTGAYEGTYAAQSGDINDNQTTSLSVTMEVMSDDEISFYHKVSSEPGYDYLRFYIDGAVKEEWAGTLAWQLSTYPVSAGEHTFKWAYEKDQSVSNGSDCGWIDFISFPAAASDAPVVYAGPDTETCEGNTYSVNATGANYETVMWETSGTGTFDDNTLLNPTYTPSEDDYANGSVTLTITAYGNGQEMEDFMELSFMPMPGQCASPQGETALCMNAGTITYETTEMANVSDYTWVLEPEEAGSISFDQMVAEVSWSETFSGTAQIMVMGMNDCGEGDMSEPLEVNILEAPVAAAMPTGEADLCEGTETTTYSSGEIMYAESYEWEISPMDAGTIVSNGMEAEVSWSTGWSGAAEIMVRGVNSCGNGMDSDPLMVTMTAMPATPTMPTGNVDLCENNENTTYETMAAVGATDYTWELMPAEAGVINSNGITAEVAWSEGFSGEATVYVKSMNDCGESAMSEALVATLSALPAQAGAISGQVEVCQGNVITYTSEVSDANTCEWVVEPAEAGVVTLSGMDCEITFSATWSGNATLKVRGVNDCGNGNWSDALTVLVQDCTGIDENETTNLRVYPNPNNGIFTISLQGDDVVDISLVNAIGKTVYTETGVEVSGAQTTQIQTSGLSNGIYYLKISGKSHQSFEKIVIRK